MSYLAVFFFLHAPEDSADVIPEKGGTFGLIFNGEIDLFPEDMVFEYFILEQSLQLFLQ